MYLFGVAKGLHNSKILLPQNLEMREIDLLLKDKLYNVILIKENKSK